MVTICVITRSAQRKRDKKGIINQINVYKNRFHVYYTCGLTLAMMEEKLDLIENLNCLQSIPFAGCLNGYPYAWPLFFYGGSDFEEILYK